MIYAVIAAGGKGTRMDESAAPKQLLSLCSKPVIIHTLEKFVNIPEFEKIVVLCPEQWQNETQKAICQFINFEKIDIVAGGETRSLSLINAIDHIENTYGLDESTIIVTHDGVRPFVSEEIIRSHLKKSAYFKAIGTAVSAVDTVFTSKDGKEVCSIPSRDEIYLAQTPQTFNALLFRRLYNELSEKEKESLTDGCKIFSLKGYTVGLVEGDRRNIKITYPVDMLVGEALLSE